MTLDPVAAGQRFTPEATTPWVDEINRRGVVGFGDRRTASSGSTGTEVSVLRVDDLQLVDGYAYEIKSTPLRGTGGANDQITARLRITQDGSTPTSSSFALLTVSSDIDDVGTFEDMGPLQYMHEAIGNEVLSLLLTIQRTAGTAGTASLGGDANYPIQLWVVCLGPAVADTGVDL